MDPIAFQLGRLTITWYGILVVCGFMAGLWTASRRAPRYGLAGDTLLDMGPWLMLGTILGARAWYCIAYWDDIVKSAAYYHESPALEVFMVQHAGLVFYGGLIGASLTCILYAHWRKLPLWRLADALAPSIALGSAFGRVGCLMNGCCYGKVCTAPWVIKYLSIRFPPGHESYPDAVYPVQIFDSLLNLGLYAILAWFYRRKKFDGQVFALYLMFYAATRSFVEMFRGDYTPEHLFHGWLTPAQLASVIGVIVGCILLWKLPRGGVKAPATEPSGVPENA